MLTTLDTLLRIRLFVAVYEERSFTVAAARERATQSGVTQHVRKLEDAFGVLLFVRGPAGIVPTPLADAYYRRCIDILRGHEQARALLKSRSGSTLSGEVIAGLTPTLTRGVLAPALSRFMASHPNVVVRVIDAYSDIIAAKVRSGDLDFGVVPGFRPEPGVRGTPFGTTPEFLVSGRGSGLGLEHRAPVQLASVGPLKMVLPSALQTRRRDIERYFAATGARIAERMEIDSSPGSREFVARTDWVSIHPAISLIQEYADARVVVNPLTRPVLMLDLFRIERARQPLSPAAEAFAGALAEQTEHLRARTMRMVRGPLSPAQADPDDAAGVAHPGTADQVR